MTERGAVLDEARKTINGDRQDAYGNPEDSFRMISDLWTAFLDKYVSPQDVAMMMVLLKCARQKTGKGKRDNFVDMCGYAALAADMAEKE